MNPVLGCLFSECRVYVRIVVLRLDGRHLGQTKGVFGPLYVYGEKEGREENRLKIPVFLIVSWQKEFVFCFM